MIISELRVISYRYVKCITIVLPLQSDATKYHKITNQNEK